MSAQWKENAMSKRRRFLGDALLPASAAALAAAPAVAAPSPAAWNCVLQLDSKRQVTTGSAEALAAAIRRGADLRIGTSFHHNEHIDTASQSRELIQEVAEFRTTYLLDNRWTAALMTLRQPIALPDQFGPRPSMSFFLYNQDGRQAIARPYLDGGPAKAKFGAATPKPDPSMPKYHQFDSWDPESNAPSHNFVYDFEVFRYLVRDDWQEVLSHAPDGRVVAGSARALADAFYQGREVKVAIRNLCADLAGKKEPLEHEVFVQTGSCYYYTEQQLFIAGTHPTVRIQPAIPLSYSSRNWDFGWLMARSDGMVRRSLVDPYTLSFRQSRVQCALRWFVR